MLRYDDIAENLREKQRIGHISNLKNSSSLNLHPINDVHQSLRPKRLEATCSRRNEKFKLKRPDKPLYVPRALRCQKEIACDPTDKEICITDSKESSSKKIERKLSLNVHENILPKSKECVSKNLNGAMQNFCDSICIDIAECDSFKVDSNIFASKMIISTTNDHEDVNAAVLVKTDFELSNELSRYCHSDFSENNINSSAECDDYGSLKFQDDVKHQSAVISNNSELACTSISQDDNDRAIYTIKSLSDASLPTTEEGSWDSMFDDQGECLSLEAQKELTAAIGSAVPRLAKNDYTEFRFSNNDNYAMQPQKMQEFNHIVELHGFPVAFSTQDLVSALSCFKTENFTIKWVDDCHALAVFSSPFAAAQAVQLEHPFVKVRPLSAALEESKMKAKKISGYMEPIKPRPATSATIARRLVTGALGIKVQVPKEQKEKERQKILEARAQRQKMAKQRKNMWDGVMPE